MHHILVALADGPRGQLGGVQPGVRLGHGEAGLLAAGDQRLQPSRTLLVAAEHDDRVQAEDIHMDGGRTGKPRARGRDGLHHQCGFGHAQSGAAVFLRHGDAQPAVARQVGVQRLGKAAFAVAFQPVFIGVTVANARNGVTQRQLIGGEGKVHQLFPSWVMPRSTRASIRAAS
ncbi:hypothetical protein G6F24_016119 [Rhizopus arrhizus]|nr:hypothetical protein G6F24_016119 [Rhizopus arrhizus]